tara:strand:- start:311 stop:610 length:300 start_codon:yes stop_codon:yes gene_type:complete
MPNVSITDSATQIVAKNLSRIGLFIKNHEAGSTIFIGVDSTVTVDNGYPFVYPNQWVFDFHGNNASLPSGIYQGAFFGIVASGTADLRYLELISAEDFE